MLRFLLMVFLSLLFQLFCARQRIRMMARTQPHTMLVLCADILSILVDQFAHNMAWAYKWTTYLVTYLYIAGAADSSYGHGRSVDGCLSWRLWLEWNAERTVQLSPTAHVHWTRLSLRQRSVRLRLHRQPVLCVVLKRTSSVRRSVYVSVLDVVSPTSVHVAYTEFSEDEFWNGDWFIHQFITFWGGNVKSKIFRHRIFGT